ncbi:MAG TPA: hypothetical protein VGO00_04265, partial [Kofleriaceae bacterium]|nr:hypothetical protein [Kofleriaceae bacterium]
MNRSFAFSFVLALGVASVGAGCSSNPQMMGDDGNGDDGGGDDVPPPPPPTPLDPTGTFRLQNTFDIASNMPGTVGDVLNAIIDMTDGPNDPSDWLLTQIINQLGSGPLQTALQAAEPTIAGILNQELVTIAPDFVNTMKEVGQDFGAIAKHFGLNSKLAVSKTATDTAFTAVHTFDGAHFKVETIDKDYNFSDYMVPNIVVNNLTIGIDLQNNFSVSEHTVPVPYGAVLRIGLDAAIIPLIDSNATNLDQLMEDKIDCVAVGQAIADALGFGSATTYEVACHAGLQYGATFIYQEIAKIDDSVLSFDMKGAAKAGDTNNDHVVDKLSTGTWSGTLSYAGSTPAPLSTATFVGTRQ